jgi:hypothetical protein
MALFSLPGGLVSLGPQLGRTFISVPPRLVHLRLDLCLILLCLSVARKLCRRAYHILRELGDEALAPINAPIDEEVIAAAA